MVKDENEFYKLLQQTEQLNKKAFYLDALDGYRQLLKFRLQNSANLATTFNSNDAIVVERLADLSLLFNQTEAADVLLSGLQQLLSYNKNIYVYLYIALKRADIAINQGKFKFAFGILESLSDFFGDAASIDFERLDIWEKSYDLNMIAPDLKQVIYSRALYVYGSLLINLGQYNHATAALLYGLKKTEHAVLPILQAAVIPYKLAIAKAHLEKGGMEQAMGWLDKINKNELIQYSINNYIFWLELTSKIKLLTGDLGEAALRLTEIKDLCIKHKLYHACTTALINLANVKIYLNQITQALALLDDAEALSQKASAPEFAVQISFTRRIAGHRGVSQIASISIIPGKNKLNQQDDNADSLNNANEINRPENDYQSPDYLAFFEDRAARFQMILGDRKFDKAILELNAIREVFKDTDSALIQNRIMVLQYMLAFYTEGKAIDTQQLTKAESYFEAEGLKPELWQLYRFMYLNSENTLGQREIFLNRSMEIIDELSQSLPIDEQSIFLLNKWTLEEQYFANEVNTIVDLDIHKRQSTFIRRWSYVLACYRAINKLAQKIDDHKQKVVQKVVQQDVWDKITGKSDSFFKNFLGHARDMLTISFLVLPDQTIVIYKSRFILKFMVAPVTRIELRQLLRNWHELSLKSGATRFFGTKSTAINGKDMEDRCIDLSTQIADKIGLTEILRLMPDNINRIRFVPDDVLTGFPFATVRHKDKFLIEQFALSTSFKSDGYNNHYKNKNGKNKALFAYVAEGEQQRFSALPGTKTEVELISGLVLEKYKVKNIKILGDAEASKENILNELNNAALVHIACHGVFEKEQPDQSGLILLKNQRITIRDMVENSAFGTLDHVTLSSCWAADHFVLPGRWVISLPETLYRAGVGSILGCFWEVNDRVAIAFMKSFYEYASYLPKDVALQKTQIDCIKNKLIDSAGETSGIFYWSGFCIYGNVAPLKI